jgi:hypothetical protein
MNKTLNVDVMANGVWKTKLILLLVPDSYSFSWKYSLGDSEKMKDDYGLFFRA